VAFSPACTNQAVIAPIPNFLHVGVNTFTVLVTAPSAVQQSYTILVRLVTPVLDVTRTTSTSGGYAVGLFTPAANYTSVFQYSVVVGVNNWNVQFTPVPLDATATVQVNYLGVQVTAPSTVPPTIFVDLAINFTATVVVTVTTLPATNGSALAVNTYVFSFRRSAAPVLKVDFSRTLNGALKCITPNTWTVNVGVSGGNFFLPQALTVSVGDKVNFVWHNGSQSVTQTTASGGCVPVLGGFDSGIQSVPFTFSSTFSTVGTFYFMSSPNCAKGMFGQITVRDFAPLVPPDGVGNFVGLENNSSVVVSFQNLFC